MTRAGNPANPMIWRAYTVPFKPLLCGWGMALVPFSSLSATVG